MLIVSPRRKQLKKLTLDRRSQVVLDAWEGEAMEEVGNQSFVQGIGSSLLVCLEIGSLN
jgi:hypothetical protein